MADLRPREGPASIGQRLLWFMEHHRGGDGSMSGPVLCRLRGVLDAGALHAALNELTRRHEVLRTTYSGAGRRLTRLIHEPRAIPITEMDLRGEKDPEKELRQALAAELRSRIDADRWPTRVTLFRLSDKDHTLCVNIHHFATDGWSTGIVVRELSSLYEAFVADTTPALPEPEWQYSEFVDDQLNHSASDKWKESSDYWKEKLDGVTICSLKDAGPRANLAERRTEVGSFVLCKRIINPLKKIAATERCTLFPVMLAVFYVFLHRRTRQTDLAVASLFANRARRMSRGTVGFFANMVLLRTKFVGDTSFLAVVRSARKTALEAIVHQHVPVQLVPFSSSASYGARVEDLMFHVLPEPLLNRRVGELDFDQFLPCGGLSSRFDLEFLLIPDRDGGFSGTIFYASDRFDRQWISMAAEEYRALAESCGADPEAVVLAAG